MAAVDNNTTGAGRAALTEPAGSAAAITKHDTDELTAVTRAIFVGGAGNMVCLMADGTTCTFTGVAAGSILPIRVKRVNSTNTTATNMVALW